MRGAVDHCLTCERWDLQEKQDSSSMILKAGSIESEAEFVCAAGAGRLCLPFHIVSFRTECIKRWNHFGNYVCSQLSFLLVFQESQQIFYWYIEQ